MSVTNGDLKVLIDNLSTLFNKHFVGGNYSFTGRKGSFVFTHDNFYFATLPSPTVQTLGLTGAVTELNFVLDWIDHRNEVVGQTITVRLLDKDDNFLAAKIATNNGYGYSITFNLPADLLAGVTNQDVRKLQVVSLNPTGNTIAVGQVNGATNISITGTEFVDQVIPDLIIQDLEAIKTQTDRLPTRELNGLTVGNVAKESTSSGSAIFTAPTDQFTADGTGNGFGWFDNPVEQLLGIEEDILAVDFRLMFSGSADGATILVELLDINKNVMSEKQVQTTTSGYTPAVFNLPEDLATGVTSLSVKYLRVTGMNADNRVYFGTPFTVSITGQRSVDTADNAGILLKLDEIQEELIDAEHKFDIDMNEFIFEPFSNETFGFYRSASSNSENVFTQQLGLSGDVDELTFSLKWTDVITTIAKDIKIELQDKNNKTLATKTANTGTTGVDVVFNLPVDLNTDETSRLVTQVKVTATAFTQLRSGKTGRIISITGVQKDAVLSNLVDIKSIVLSDTPKIDDIKTQTDRLPTVTANDGVISGDVAKLSIQTTGGGEGGFSSVDRINLNNVKTDVETLLHEYNIVLPITSFPFTAGGGLIDRLPFATQDLGLDENITAITIIINWSNFVGNLEAFAVDLLDIDGIQRETFVMNGNTKFYGNDINGTTFTFDSQFVKQIRFRQTGIQSFIPVGATNPYLNITGLATHAHENIINKIDAIKTEADGIKTETDKITGVKSQTDKLTFIQNDVTGIKSNVNLIRGGVEGVKVQTDRLPIKTVSGVTSSDVAKETELDKVKTETDKISTVLTNIDINKTSINANKTEIDLIKTQTDKVPSIIGEVNNVKLQTDKIPTTIIKVDSIKTQTDKTPATITKVDAIKVQTDRLPVKTDGTTNITLQEIVRSIPTTDFVIERLNNDISFILYGEQVIDVERDLIALNINISWNTSFSTTETFIIQLLDENDVVLLSQSTVPTGTRYNNTSFTFDPLPIKKIKFIKDVSTSASKIFVGTVGLNFSISANLAPTRIEILTRVDAIKTETDKIPTILTDVATNKSEIELVGEVVSSNKTELVKVKTETDKIPTVLTNQSGINDSINTNKTAIDAVKLDTSRLPTVDVGGVISTDVAKESTQLTNSFTSTDRGNLAEVKVQVDKIPTVLTNQGTLSTSIGTNNTAITANKTQIDLIKTQTDKVPATITKIDSIKTQTDRLPTLTVDGVTTGDVAKESTQDGGNIPADFEAKVDAIKLQTDKTPATIVKVDGIKTETDKIPTVLTDIGVNKTAIGTNKAELDLIKIQTDRLPTKTLSGVTSGDVAKQTDLSNVIGTTNNIKTQTDKVPATITKIDSIKTETDKVPATIVKVDSIKTETDKVPATITKIDTIKIQTDRLPVKTVLGVVSGDVAKETDTDIIDDVVDAVRAETDKIPATILKIDAIKTQSDRLPTLTATDGTVTGDVAKESTQDGGNIPPDFEAKVDAIKTQTDRLPTQTANGVTTGDTAKESTQLTSSFTPVDRGNLAEVKVQADKIPTVLTDIGVNKTAIDAIKVQTDRLPTLTDAGGVVTGDVAKESTLEATNEFTFDAPTYSFVFVPEVGEDYGSYGTSVVQDLGLDNDVKELVLELSWTTSLPDQSTVTTVDLLDDNNTALATKSFTTGAKGGKVTFKLPDDLNSGVTSQNVRFLKIKATAGGLTEILSGTAGRILTINGIGLSILTEDIIKIKTQTDRLPLNVVDSVISSDIALNSKDLSTTQKNKITGLTLNTGVNIASIKDDTSSIQADTTAIKIQNVAITSDVDAVAADAITIKSNLSTVDTNVDSVKTQTDKIPTVITQTDKIPATIQKIDAIKVQSDRLPTKTVGSVVSGDVAKESTQTTDAFTAADRTAIGAIKADTVILKTDSAAVKSDTTTLKSGQDEIKNDLITLFNNTDDVQVEVDKIKVDTSSLIGSALSNAEKAKIQGLPSDLGNSLTAIKTDTTTLKGTTVNIKSDTGKILDDTTLLKDGHVEINSQLDTIESGVDIIEGTTNSISNNELTASQKAKIDAIPLSIAADINDIETKIDAIKAEVDKITSVETKIDALKVQLTNKETGLSSSDKADLIAAIVLTEQYDYQQTNTEFIVTDSTNSNAVIARFTISKDGDGNVTRRQLQ